MQRKRQTLETHLLAAVVIIAAIVGAVLIGGQLLAAVLHVAGRI